MKRNPATPRLDLNASSAERWTTCTASPKFIFDNWHRLPPDKRTYSDEGNTAHEIAAALLQGREVNPDNCPVPETAEMHQHAWNYMEFVESFRKPGSTLLVEQEYPLFYAEGRRCFIDAAVISPDRLDIVDLKYGQGVVVPPFRNKQLAIYGKSVLYNHAWPIRLPDDFPVGIHIYQPRTRDDEPYHTWETTKGEIEQIANRIAYTAAEIQTETRQDLLKFAPSEKACQFCPAKGFCEARSSRFLAEIPNLMEIEKPPVHDLTTHQMVAIIEHGEAIKKWVDDQQEYILEQMKAGKLSLPGYKLVLSRGGNRAWSDPEKAGKLLLESTVLAHKEVYTQKVISVKQAEDKLGKNKFSPELDALIFKPPGNPIIVPESDKREALDGALAEIEAIE